jgi:hypothetical protein
LGVSSLRLIGQDPRSFRDVETSLKFRSRLEDSGCCSERDVCEEDDNFGGAVAIGSSLVIAGARSHDELGSSVGSAYLFDALVEADVNNNGIPNACEPTLGDLDGDGVIGSADLLILLAFWGPCPPPPLECLGDLNVDEVVGVADLIVLLANWS